MAKGRPPKFVDQRTGKPVKGNGVPLVGLSLHKNGTYYATGTKPRVYFGKDFGLAKAQFRQWQHRHEGPTAADVKEKTGADRDKALFEFSRWHQDHPGEYMTFTAYSKEDATEHVLQIPSQAVWDRMHDLFFENPAKFAENIRVPAMANLDHLKKPAPSLNLDAVGTMYLDRTGKPLNFRWRRDCKGYWEEFCKLTACKTLADLDADSVAGYREAIYQARIAKKKKPRYVNNRFDAIGCVLNHAKTEGKDTDNLTRVTDLLKMLRRLDSDEENPQPIEREDFHKLLDAADTKWKAILLLSLNCAFYPVDVAQVRKEHINLENKWLIGSVRTKTRRGKRKSPRIAVLWDRTVAAIEKYYRDEPHDAETVFVSELGTPYAEKSLQNYYRDSLRDAKTDVPGTVGFNQIRDGAATAAGNGEGVEPVHVDMLLGHRIGQKARYWFRKPWIVADACAAIERYYFPPATTK